MKKSVILVILSIYILSIVIVGVLGVRLKVYDSEEYITEIRCVTEGVVYSTAHNCDAEIKVKDFKVNTKTKVLLEFEYKTNNSEKWIKLTDPNLVDFSMEKEQDGCTLINNKDGTIYLEINKSGGYKVRIKSVDGKMVSTKVYVYAIDNTDDPWF